MDVLNQASRVRPSILLIEGTSGRMDLLAEALGEDYELFAATSGEKALAMLNEMQAPWPLPDLIILDVAMPDMDGCALLGILKQDPRLREIPVIFVAADSDFPGEAEALAAGAADFINNPVNREVTQARVRTQIDLQLQRKALASANQQFAYRLDEIRTAQRELERARARELEIGVEIQQQLLFGAVPEALAGYEITCYTEGSQGIDGDFYTFTQIGPTAFEVLTGDVMGKGIAAALIGAGIKNVYRKVFAELLTLEKGGAIPAVDTIVNAIHATVTPRLISVGAFVTLTLLRFDLDAETVTWVNAGHTPTLIASSGQSEIGELIGDNLPLGVIEQEIYTQQVTPFGTNDLLLIYSDGLSESIGPDKTEYGIDRIKSVLNTARQSGMPPKLALNALREDLNAFTGGGRAADDRTVVLVQAASIKR